MKTIAVIFGGRSAEHDISIVTALSSVIKPLKLIGKYNVVPIYISKDGAWYWDDQLSDITLFSSGRITSFIEKTQPVQLQFDGGLTLIKSSGFKSRKLSIDIVFPAMHGTYGEDGALMGMLEMANVPYVGSGLSASAIAMDKVLAKEVTVANNIPTTSYVALKKVTSDISAHIKTVESTLKYPLFVKPAHLGSSIGISRAVNQQELQNALEVAAHYDDTIIVEEEVQNLIEVTLPIIGNNDLTPALLERPLTSAEDFFDFETKYLNGGGKKKGGAKKGGPKGAQGYSELPAKLPTDLYKKAEETALNVYRALGCSGTARVDLLIDSKTKNVYFNEVNPLPGGLYAHNWRAKGMSSVELVGTLVDLALERYAQKQQLTTAFTTNYLQQF